MSSELSFAVTLTVSVDGWTAEVTGQAAVGVIGQAMDTPREAIQDAVDDYLIAAGYVEDTDDE